MFSFIAAIAVVVVVTALGASCSSDGDAEVDNGIAGQKEGTERWVVYFDDEGPDLEAYKSALKTGAPTTEIEKSLRDGAATARKDFAKALKDLTGDVVEFWFLTNAVTVELPAGNVGSLRLMKGVKRIEPDRLIE